MKNIKKPKILWTKELCHKEALKYTNKREFTENASGAITKAYKMGWVDEICAHMKKNHFLADYNFEMLKEIASKYKSQQAFKMGNRGAHDAAYKLGYMTELFRTRRFVRTEESAYTKRKKKAA